MWGRGKKAKLLGKAAKKNPLPVILEKPPLFCYA
jgi:hypothetical protein